MVNGALEYLSKDLGILENTVVQGKDCIIFNRCSLSHIFTIIHLVVYRSTYQLHRLLLFSFKLNSRKLLSSYQEFSFVVPSKISEIIKLIFHDMTYICRMDCQYAPYWCHNWIFCWWNIG